MVWLLPAAGFGLLAALLGRRLGPGPRWPFLLLFPVAAISLLYLAEAVLMAHGRGHGLDLFLAGPAGQALFALRFVCILMAVVLAQGGRLFVIAAALALLSLDAGLVFGVLSLFQCAAGPCGAS